MCSGTCIELHYISNSIEIVQINKICDALFLSMKVKTDFSHSFNNMASHPDKPSK